MAEERSTTPLIMIDDEYGISVDPIDYSLRKVIKSEKTGKTRQETCGYFSSLRNCLKAYVTEKAHDSLTSNKDMTLKEAVKRINDAMDKVYKVINAEFPDYEVIKK